MEQHFNAEVVENNIIFDVIVVGGSYSGLSAALALGRSLRNVLIIDGGKPCNIQTPHSHNFLTQDGSSPKQIADVAKLQVLGYQTVKFKNGKAISAEKERFGFTITTDSGEAFKAKKIIFATGLKDIMPDIEGFSECWGISVIHCPYCHGYEFRSQNTGILSNNEMTFEFAQLISNWSKSLTIFTNGKSVLPEEQHLKLEQHHIKIVEKVISKVNQTNGIIETIQFVDGSLMPIDAVYARVDFEQHCKIPVELGCEVNEQGLLKVDNFQKTTVPGIYASGDNSAMRSVAFAVSTGSMAGVMVNKELIFESL